MSTATYEQKTKDRPQSGHAKPDADQEEMMKKMAAAGAPGPAHKALEALVGHWKAEVKCWMDKGGSPEVTQATAEVKPLFNGRFIEEEFHGQMMGKLFTGRLILGFDNTKQTYNSVWFSDMGTSIFISEGKTESGNKVISLEGKSSCPASGRTDIPMKSVYRLSSPSQHVFEMYDGSKGEYVKSMEIVYTRQ